MNNLRQCRVSGILLNFRINTDGSSFGYKIDNASSNEHPGGILSDVVDNPIRVSRPSRTVMSNALNGILIVITRTSRFALILLGVALVAGCATMNKEECLYADWQENGYNDGTSGADRDTLRERGESCAKHGIIPDKEAYLEGYEDGLEEFCTSENGYDKGRRGYNYKGVCPPGREGLFLIGYNEGRVIYELESRLAEYQSAMDQRSQQLNNIAYQNYQDENILASKEATDQDRQQALARIRYRQRQVYILRNELFSLQQYHQDLSNQLMQLNPGHWPR